MRHKQFFLTLLVAIISGFLGGMLGVWFLMPPSVLAQDEPPKVITAEEFRVVDREGEPVAFLRSQGEVGELVFSYSGRERLTLGLDWGGVEYTPSINLISGEGVGLLSIGIPTVRTTRSDGSVEPTFEDPIIRLISEDLTHMLNMDSSRLWLGEVDGEQRIQLTGDSIRLDGTDDVFSFMSSTNVAFYKGDQLAGQDVPAASLDTKTEPTLVLWNPGKGAIRLSTNDGPTLRLTNSNFDERLVLGRISLRNSRTGSTEVRALSSIVLFEEGGNAVWSAP